MSYRKLSMALSRFTFLLVISITSALLPSVVHAQFFKSSSLSNVDQSGFFVIATREQSSPTGLLGLVGLAGAAESTTSYRFGIRDENGYQHETLDLVTPKIVEELDLSSEQIEVMREIRDRASAELVRLIEEARAQPPAEGVSVAEAERSYGESMKEKFSSAVADMKSSLSEGQLLKLGQLKHLNGIEQLGLGNYVRSSHFESSLSGEDVNALEQMMFEFRKLSKAKARELLKAANRKLLDELTSEQQGEFSSKFSQEFTDELLATAMFTRRYSTKKRLVKRKADLYRILKSKNVRNSIGLSNEEYSKVKKLDVEQGEKLTEKLTVSQKMKLEATIVLSDLKRMGTVHAISSGHFRDFIGIEDDTALRVYQAGQSINRDLVEQLVLMKKEAFKESIALLSKPLQESLDEMLGEYVVELSMNK